MNLLALRDELLTLAREAGAAILQIYQQDFAVQQKADESPLTAADLAAHRCLSAGLPDLLDVPVLSEEAEVAWEARRHWSRYWLVDPLDGTREFVNRNDEFTVNVALIEHHRPVLGLVLQPVGGRAWAGIPGQGAWSCEAAGAWQPVGVAPVAAVPRIATSRSHANDRTRRWLACIGSHMAVPLGSSLKFCLLAEGRIDCYPRLGPTSEWDTAAAQAVVEAAGGQVLDWQGRPLRYNERPSLLNPEFLVCAGDPVRWLKCYISKEDKT